MKWWHHCVGSHRPSVDVLHMWSSALLVQFYVFLINDCHQVFQEMQTYSSVHFCKNRNLWKAAKPSFPAWTLPVLLSGPFWILPCLCNGSKSHDSHLPGVLYTECECKMRESVCVALDLQSEDKKHLRWDHVVSHVSNIHYFHLFKYLTLNTRHATKTVNVINQINYTNFIQKEKFLSWSLEASNDPDV